MDSDRIAVIGMACHYPGARDLRRFWENVLARRRQFRRIPDCRLPLSDYYDPDPAAPDKTYCDRGAFIDDFSFDLVEHRIPRSSFDSSDIAHWLALDVALRSIEDAGYSRATVTTERSGVILGNSLTGEHSRSEGLRLRWPFVERVIRSAAAAKGLSPSGADELVRATEAYYKSVFAPVTEDTLAGALSNTIAGRICNYLDFHGGGYTVDGACSSSVIAVATAANALCNRDMDLALAGGVDVSLDTLELIGFAKTGAITPSDMRVYDRRADGFIPGEGCGFVVLKRLEDAVGDGDHIYAILNGWGISSDGRGGLTAPNARGQSRALSRAYERSGYDVTDLDFIEGHGTGTSVGDVAEIESIVLAMGDAAGSRACGVTSLKSIIGHTKAASGIGAFIKAVMAVNRRVVPPLANCDDPNPVFDEKAQALYPVLRGSVRPPEARLRAGVSGMGFGGINCHLTIESGDPPAERLEPEIAEEKLLVSNQDSELFVLSAATIDQLAAAVGALSNIAQGISEGELVDLAAHMAIEHDQGMPLRVAVVAGSPSALAAALDRASQLLSDSPPAAGISTSDEELGVFIGNDVHAHRVGFLFPGQGSQQLNMSRKLADRHRWARQIADTAEAELDWPSDRRLTGLIFRDLERAADTVTADSWGDLIRQSEFAQPAICLASTLWLNRLAGLGILPAAVGGHSLGELTAFHAAGALTMEELVAFAAFRGEVMAATGDGGAMASLACPLEVAVSVLNQVNGYVIAANMNSPKQTVISGERSSVARAIDIAKDKGITTHLLPVANAFHSKFVAGAAEKVRRAEMVPAVLESLSTKLFSSVEGQRIATGINLREHFAAQITSPVDFISLVKSMAGECDMLLEVGPGRVLSNLAGATIGKGGPGCYAVEARPGQDGYMNRFLAAYFVNGGSVNWDALYEDRLVRPFTPASERSFLVNPCERPFAADPAVVSASITTGSAADSLLAEAADISPEALSRYLERRGAFLGSIISADLASMPDLQAIHAMQERQTADAAPVAEPAPAAAGVDAGESVEKEAAGDDDASSAADVLVRLVEERTGFPRDSISLEMRLLDDLNLDSIKASELIAEAAKKLGVAADIDVAEYANAELSAIAAVLEGPLPEGYEGEEESSPEPVRIERPGWVRDYRIEYVDGELPEPGAAAAADRSGEAVLVLHEPADESLAREVSRHFNERYAAADTLTYAAMREGDESRLEGYGTVIALLARQPAAGGRAAETVAAHVRRLHTIFAHAPRGADGNHGRLAVVQFGGGRFGTGQRTAQLDQCSAAALAASLHLERQDLAVRVLDLHPDLPATQLSAAIAAELATADSYGAAGYDADGVRRIPRPAVMDIAGYRPRAHSWGPDDVFLITGGAKGITAECALELARATGARVALAGSSLPPDERGNGKVDEVAQTLGRFEAEGLTAGYYQCDLVDAGAVARLVHVVSEDMGRITGVIHGSALNRPGELGSVGVEDALEEVSPKLLGAINLCEALAEAPPRLFIGFASIIGVSGMVRNGWYGFSNEALNLVLQRFGDEHQDTSVLSIAFSIWDEVGMGARMGSTGYLARMGIDAIPVREGVERFLRLVTHDPGEGHVVVAARTDGLDTFVPAGKGDLPEGRRFLEEAITHHPGIELAARARLSLDRDAYIGDHAWRGTWLFPMVFGLEAMAQAVAAVTGRESFGSVRIEDIGLDRPITVTEGQETEIEVHARVLERTAGDPVQRVRVGMRTDQTGFAHDHFTATFCFNAERSVREEEAPPDGGPLEVDPGRDLYREEYLFQGPKFQRIEAVHELDSSGCVFRTVQHPREASAGDEGWLTGDPFLRDSLLQSVQVPLPRDICLPLRIESIERFPVDISDADSLWGRAIIERRTDKDVHSSVTLFNSRGEVAERISGYVARVIEHHPERPTAEEIADPGERDRALIEAEVSKRCRRHGLAPPEVDSEFIPGIKSYSRDQRRDRELPLLNSTAYRALGEPVNGSRISWTADGKPFIDGSPDDAVDISLTHNLGTVFCAAGKAPQGCDLETVTPRGREEWLALLTGENKAILEQLELAGDSLDTAGTRIWTASEAAWKAFSGGRPGLTVDKRDGDDVIFGISGHPGCRVLTFPVTLTLAGERMVALVTQDDSGTGKSATPRGEGSVEHGTVLDAGEWFNGDGEFSHEFKTTFIDGRTPAGRVSFANIPVWMGKLRELALEPVAARMVEDMGSGEWAMVTNASAVAIERPAGSLDTIVGTIRLLDETDLDKSFISVGFDWSKKTADGREVLIATSRLSTTWVSIEGHGAVKKAPLPGYFREFLEQIPLTDAYEWSHEEADDQGLKPVFAADISSRRDILLVRQSFATTMEDSNLVGNIYYSNYYSWQARLLDRFLYEQFPDLFRQNGHGRGEFTCTGAAIDHLQEAMPFETVEVSMFMHELFAQGFSVYFEYHSVDDTGAKRKLAHGRYSALWTLAAEDGDEEIEPAQMPDAIFRKLQAIAAGKPDIVGAPLDRPGLRSD